MPLVNYYLAGVNAENHMNSKFFRFSRLVYNGQLLVFERKILRRIFGPTKENQIWRVKTNEELDKLIKRKNTINYIKAHRLSWFGHVQRMPDTRTVKEIINS